MSEGRKSKPRLLVISHVLPFPRSSGQQQRVFYTLQAARQRFHITFATVANGNAEKVRDELSTLCDEVLLLPSQYSRSKTGKAFYKAAGAVHALRTGLKFSNYVIGEVEFSPTRVGDLLRTATFDCALFEYWHAIKSVPVLREKGIPCVLDMHDILWRSYAAELEAAPALPKWWRNLALSRYKKQEEDAWKQFDGLIAINSEEQRYVHPRLSEAARMFNAPMGVDLDFWPFCWEPAQPIRVGYYGGLGSSRNQEAALRCVKQIMPKIWRRFPEAELWLVGSNPPESIRALSSDPRVKVTGYVEDVKQVLSTMSLILCPWSGTFGFRSRLVEAMALGVPVVASPDAVHGMELEDGNGLLLGSNDDALAGLALRLLTDEAYSSEQSQLARGQVERLFSISNTYGRLVSELSDWLQLRRR